MRTEVYRVFEIVAWPALVWCALELGLRGAVRDFDGAAATTFLGVLASLTVLGCRLRTAQLRLARAPR